MSVMHAGARAPMVKGQSILLLQGKFQDSFRVQVHMTLLVKLSRRNDMSHASIAKFYRAFQLKGHGQCGKTGEDALALVVRGPGLE